MKRIILAFALSGAVSLAGWRSGALTTSGTLASMVVGTAIIRRTGIAGSTLLGAFFVTGSLASKLARDPEVVAKRGSRDALQVIANGGVAAVSSVIIPTRRDDLALLAVAGALSAATADTWATAAGLRFGATPRRIVTGEAIAPGLSGGVSSPGTLGSVAGAGFIATIGRATRLTWTDSAIIASAGILGSALDSLIGDLLQEKRRSTTTGDVVEGHLFLGVPTVYHSGIKWIDNDFVNLSCTLAGAFLAVVAATANRP